MLWKVENLLLLLFYVILFLKSKYFSNINTIYIYICYTAYIIFLMLSLFSLHITCSIIKGLLYYLPENLLLNTDRKLFSQALRSTYIFTKFSSGLIFHAPFFLLLEWKFCVKQKKNIILSFINYQEKSFSYFKGCVFPHKH